MRKRSSIMNLSIKSRLILVSIIIILLTSSSVSIFSYLAAENVIQTQAADWVRAYIDQTVNRFDFYLNSILRASMSISFNNDLVSTIASASSGNYEDYNRLLRAMDLISVFNNTNLYVYEVRIYSFRNNMVLSSKGQNKPIDIQSEEYGIIKNLLIDSPKARTVMNKWLENRTVTLSGKKIQAFTFIMPVNDRYSNDVIGCVVTYIEENQISNFISEPNLSVNAHASLVDSQGRVISSADKSLLGADYSDYLNPGDSNISYNYLRNVQGKSYLVTYAGSQYAGWGFVSVIPVSDLMKKNTGILGETIILIACVAFLVAFLISNIFNSNFYKPLKHLIVRIKNHDVDSEGAAPELTRNDEIGFISRSFNEILSERRELIKNVYEQKLHLKEAEIRLLHSQINPHFLYNSLDNVIWMNKLKRYEESNYLVKAIIKFFRFSLSRGDEIVTVEQEKEQIENYSLIQKIRYADRLDFEIDFDCSILRLRMLKLLLQPIVENAIYHGIEQKPGKGVIRITGRRLGNLLVFCVIDNGMGLSSEKLEEVRQMIQSEADGGEGFSALRNINNRMRLFYGEKYGMSLESIEYEGTTAEIRIPVLDDAPGGLRNA